MDIFGCICVEGEHNAKKNDRYRQKGTLKYNDGTHFIVHVKIKDEQNTVILKREIHKIIVFCSFLIDSLEMKFILKKNCFPGFQQRRPMFLKDSRLKFRITVQL